MREGKVNMNIQEKIKQMTLEEKASLMSGANFWNTKEIERLHIPGMMLTDGPHGLRKQGGKADHLGLNKSLPATCFPTAATLANSWDQELVKEVGVLLGKEAASEDVSVLLGPGLNIKRNPLCGRNFEYFSEDPYLSGKMAAAMIQGIQEVGISACPKHFAVNSQETRRMTVDERVDERALHELYLEGFRYAMQEGKAKTIMTSYNKVNGEYANENTYLLQHVLRDTWGFDGLIVTDWGGNNDRVEGLKAGNALEMPSTNGMTDKEIVEAVKSGELDETYLDLRVAELLGVVYNTLPAKGKGREFTYNEHHEKAIQAAGKSIVLLKNEGQMLPLQNAKDKIAIIGDFAKTPRYQGAGSSLIVPTKVDSLLEAMKASELNIIGYEEGFKRLGGKSEAQAEKACVLAKQADVILLFLGLDEGSEAEGVDRKHMRLSTNQVELLERLYQINPQIVLVLAGGAPIEMPFIDKVKAIVHGYLPGQGGGIALKKIITGEWNPSGKLAETYPVKYEDVPSHSYYPGEKLTSEHRESIYIGYRYFDTAGKAVRFPFGHGLSYTTFEYSNMTLDDRTVDVTITNTGKYQGEEVVQVYVKSKQSVTFKPEKELKGFAKVALQPGEQKQVSITLDQHAFAFYHIELGKWVEEPGSYEVWVGASSRELKLCQTIEIKSEAVSNPYPQQQIAVYKVCELEGLTKADFEGLLGSVLPDSTWDTKKLLDKDDIIEQAQYAGCFGRILYKLIIMVHHLLKMMGRPIAANNVMFVLEMPFRSVARMSGGRVNMSRLEGLLMMVNGRFWKGIKVFIQSRNK